MITFLRTMDPNSLDIFRDWKLIGRLQRHPQRSHRVVLVECTYLTIEEMKDIMNEYEKVKVAINFEQFYDKISEPIELDGEAGLPPWI